MVLGSEKLDKKLHELKFKTCVPSITKFIKEYGEDVRIHCQLKKENSCPALPESTGTGTLENDTLKEYMEEVHTMLYVTSLEWTEKGAVKKWKHSSSRLYRSAFSSPTRNCCLPLMKGG